MARLEELKRAALVKGILPDTSVTVVTVKWHGSNAGELTYKDTARRLDSELLYRDRELILNIVEASRAWSFESDGALFRLVSEAYRIRLAFLLRVTFAGPSGKSWILARLVSITSWLS
jgi:hypothetical protein